jgi:O-methyltransferase
MKRILGPDKEQVILAQLKSVLGVRGAVAECGVYCGSTLRQMALAAPDKAVYGFDTFEGLPAEMHATAEPHKVGDFADTSLEAVAEDMPQNVMLVQGVFPQSAADMKAKFAFVHLDFDFYESTRASLEWLLPRMSDGGKIVFDDYEWDHCPGVKRAIDEFGLAVKKTVPYQVVWTK